MIYLHEFFHQVCFREIQWLSFLKSQMGFFFQFCSKSMYYFSSSNKITHQTLGFLEVNSTSIYRCNVIFILKQRQVSGVCQVKLKSFLFRFSYFFNEKNVFVWGFQIGMFDGSCSEDCALCIERFQSGQVNNKQ